MATVEMPLNESRSAAVPAAPLQFPASRAQERFWLMTQLRPGDPAFNVAVRFALHGDVNASLLTRAFNLMIERHEALRTTFAMIDGQLMQVVAPSLAIHVPVHDLRPLPAAERAAEAERLAEVEAATRFDPSHGPLLHPVLIRTAERESILLLTVHHIVSDGWSVGVMADELAALYGALAEDRPADLPELPIQYADYTMWHREQLESADMQPSLNFWKKQVADLPEFEIAGDRPRPAHASNHGGVVTRLLPRELTGAMRDLGRAHGATLYMTALAALFATLLRHSGEREVVVGSQVAGRNLPEVEPLIGVFINTLVLRAAIDDDTTFATLLDGVADQVSQALAHQEVPFDQVVDLSRTRRSADRNPLFQINFIFQRDFVKPQRFAGIVMTAMAPCSAGAMYDLNFFMVERAEGWRLSCEYNTDLYSAEVVSRMLRHMENLLGAACLNPSQTIAALELMDAQERDRVLYEWNRTDAEYPAGVALNRLIEKQVRETPHRTAVVCGDEHLSYAELDKRANQLARHLRAGGIRRGDFVGICIQRSAGMLAAVLGVMKAGAVYVPLDPHFPRERLEFMAADCGAAAILFDAGTKNLFATSARPIVLEEAAGAISHAAATPLDDAAAPEDLAYILYTSGSTGKPKGVQIPHRALVNLLCSMRREPGIGPDDVLLAVTTLSFDIAGLELFLPLIAGATIVMAASQQAADGTQLRELIAASRATLMQATPVTWRMLIEAGWKGTPGLRVLCGGEPLKRQLADDLLQRCAELWNVYGPTETTIWSSASRIEADGQPITIGHPIANTCFYVLDRHAQPVPAGVQGELYIGGDGVARGYLNRPELTAERFVADPFRRIPGATMYRTGDRARWRPDGTVELFGRIDTQVKVRGFRIELGEIEATLARCPLVRENAVVVREQPSGEPALAAYFVATEPSDDTVAQIRGFLAQALPDYMVPAYLTPLERMPLTPNGKIDRKALPAPQQRLQADAFEGARDELEARLIRVWESVLNVRPISRTADFFELGGRSVLAARLFAQIANVFGKSLPLATLFQAPTVERLASVLRDAGWTPPWACLVPIRTAGSKPPFFFVHPIGGNIVNFQGFAARFDAGQPIYGLQARGLDGQEAPHTRIEDMAAHYIECIRSVQPEGPYHLGGFSAGGLVAFEMARQLDAVGERVSILALLDSKIAAPSVRGLAGLVQRGYRLQHVLACNCRYVLRMGLLPFLAKKLNNWSMRARIHSWRRRNASAGGVVGAGSLNVEEAFLVAMRSYRPDSYSGSAILFRAHDQMARLADPTLGWSHFVAGEISVHEVSGDHDTLLDEPHIGALAHDLNACLLQASEPKAAGETTRTAEAPSPSAAPRHPRLATLGQSA
jgi:amino acid adenylation domain-containing protein